MFIVNSIRVSLFILLITLIKLLIVLYTKFAGIIVINGMLEEHES